MSLSPNSYSLHRLWQVCTVCHHGRHGLSTGGQQDQGFYLDLWLSEAYGVAILPVR